VALSRDSRLTGIRILYFGSGLFPRVVDRRNEGERGEMQVARRHRKSSIRNPYGFSIVALSRDSRLTGIRILYFGSGLFPRVVDRRNEGERGEKQVARKHRKSSIRNPYGFSIVALSRAVGGRVGCRFSVVPGF
jgi:hypothetical protein